jgi:hypothetical protein
MQLLVCYTQKEQLRNYQPQEQMHVWEKPVEFKNGVVQLQSRRRGDIQCKESKVHPKSKKESKKGP